jgi:hypothetical protein
MAGGRPKIEIDYALVEKLASIQCTQEEMASVLGLSLRKLQQDAEFMRIYKKGMDFGKSSLRRLQWKAAEKGNTSMLIWLGKQYLQQHEPKQDIGIDANTDIISEIKSLTDKI